MKLVILLGLFAYSLASVVRTKMVVCPQPESIAPCSCKLVAFGLHVVCSNIKSSAVLQRVFKVLCEYDVNNLVLHGLNFPAPVNLFDGMKVNSLRLEDSHLAFEGPMFDGLGRSLTSLNVAKSPIADGPKAFRFALLGELRELQVQYNKWTFVDNKWLKTNVPKLHVLGLDHNELSQIDSKAFYHLTLLKQLSLADNRVSTVSRDMFPRPAGSLSRIDISHNELSSLPSDIFVDMPNLKAVVLSGNELKSIPEKTWSNAWGSLDTVLFYENSLVCDENLDWIKKHKRPSTLEGVCAAPKDRKGRSLHDVYE